MDAATTDKYEIDGSLIRGNLMLDSGVLLRALGHRPNDGESPVCRLLWKAIARSGRLILIAAPSLAEFLRKDPERPGPSAREATVVAFDGEAARLLAKSMPMGEIDKAAAPDYSKTRLKYDAMIIACASRYNADALVTLETKPHFHKLAKVAGVKTMAPIDFAKSQLVIATPAR